MLGEKWLPVAPVLRVMCVTGLIAPLLEAANALLISAGRAHLTGIATLAHLAALIAFVPVLAWRWDVTGAAFGDLIAGLALTVTHARSRAAL